MVCILARRASADVFASNTGYYLAGDGSWAGQMAAASAAADGSTGLVPAPLTGQHDSYLRGDGKWIRANNAPTAAQYVFGRTTSTQSKSAGSMTYVNFQMANTITVGSAAVQTADNSFTILPGYSYKITAGIPFGMLAENITGAGLSIYVGGVAQGAEGPVIPMYPPPSASYFYDAAALCYVTPTVSSVVQVGFNYTGASCSLYGGAFITIEVVSNANAISPFAGATVKVDGASGYTPKPLAGQQNYVLTGGGGWQPPAISVQNNMTGSRTLGTIYQNTTGKSMFVSVMDVGGVTWHHLHAYSDNTAIPTTLVSMGYADGNGCSVAFWVLNNNYYQVLQDGGGDSVRSWIEWY